MTFDLSLKCNSQLSTTGNLEITKIVWVEIDKPTILTVRSWRQSQACFWRKTYQTKYQRIGQLQSSVIFGGIHQVPFLKQAHPLQKQLKY